MKKKSKKVWHDKIESILNEYGKWSAHCYAEEKWPVPPKSRMFMVKALKEIIKIVEEIS